MQLVVDYGGVIVEHGDERDHADVLGVSPDCDPYPGWLAYAVYRAGFLTDETQYVELLSTLTGASEAACVEYVERTWLDPTVPADRERILADVASDHSLTLFSNMVKPWVEQVLTEHDLRQLFDSVLVSSELQRPKPHPRGYARCVENGGRVVMVSDEYNEDLLMADAFGMTTVWLANDDEQPYREPDYRIDSFDELPAVIDQIE